MPLNNSYKQALEAVRGEISAIERETLKLDNALISLSSNLNKIAKGKISNSDVSKQLKEQADIVEKLTEKVKLLETQNNKLGESKKKLTKLTIEEKVRTQELNKAKKLSAQSTIEEAGAYVNLIAKQKQSKKALQDLIATGKKASQTQKQFNKQLRTAQSRYDVLTKKVNRAKKAVSNFNNTGLGNLVKGARNLIGAFGIIGGATLFASAVNSAFNLTKQLDSMRFSMAAVIKDQAEFAQTQDFLRQITEDFGAELVTVTNRYIKFRAATQQAGLTAKETQEIFGTMTKAAGVLGLKTDELQGIFLALEQMVSKGKITTEELRRQLGERLPGAMDIMANSLGVTTSKLDDMLRKGQVITKDVLPGFAKQVEIAFGLDTVNKVETLQAATIRLKNAWTILVEEFNEGNNASDRLRVVFDFLANNLGRMFKLLGTVVTLFVAYKTAVIAARVQVQLMATWQLLLNKRLALMRLASIKAASGVGVLTTSFRALGAAMKANALFLAISVIAGLVFIVNKFNKSLAETSKEITKLNKESLKQVDATRSLNREISVLVDRYDELKDKSSLSVKEQTELNDIIKKIGKNVPTATIEVDRYGNAIKISSEKAKEFIEINKELADVEAKIVFEEQTKVLKSNKIALDELNSATIFHIEGIGTVKRVNGELLKVTDSRTGATIEFSLQEQKAALLYEQSLKNQIALSESLLGKTEDLSDEYDHQIWQQEELERIRKAQEPPEVSIKNTVKWLKEQIKLQKEELEFAKLRGDAIPVQEEIARLEQKITDILGKKTKARKAVNKVLEGSIQAYENIISALENEQKSLATNSREWHIYKDKIEEAQLALEAFKIEINGLDLSGFDTSSFEEASKRIQELLLETKTIEALHTTDFEDEIAKLGDQLKRKQELELEIARETAELKKQLEQEVSESLLSITNSIFDAKIMRYEEDIQRNNDYYSALLDNENLSEEQRSAIEAERDRKNAEIEKKKREEERKAAIFKKLAAIVEISITTLKAVAAIKAQAAIFAATPFTLPLAASALAQIPIVIGIGLAQATAVAAVPIPRFYKGKGEYDNYEGMAIWGERKQEAKINERAGTIEFSPNNIGNHLTHVKSDDIIHPDASKLLDSMQDDNIYNNIYMQSIGSGDGFVQYSMAKSIDDGIRKQTVEIVNALNRKRMSTTVNNKIDLGNRFKFLERQNNTL